MNIKTNPITHDNKTGADLFIPRNTLRIHAMDVNEKARTRASKKQNPYVNPANGNTPVKCQIVD